MGLMQCPFTTLCVASGHGLSIMEFAFLSLEEKNDHNRAGVDKHGLLVVGCLFARCFQAGSGEDSCLQDVCAWQCNRHFKAHMMNG